MSALKCTLVNEPFPSRIINSVILSNENDSEKREKIMSPNMEVLPHPLYSLPLTPPEDQLFRSFQQF